MKLQIWTTRIIRKKPHQLNDDNKIIYNKII